jgi:hypothetical protein
MIVIAPSTVDFIIQLSSVHYSYFWKFNLLATHSTSTNLILAILTIINFATFFHC